MQSPTQRWTHNPLADLISDEDFRILETHNLLSERAIRDYQMRRSFLKMRREHVPAFKAIERLREAHPYLQADTIRKIVYNTGAHRQP